MPSTYSPNLRLELIGDGEQEGYWGRTTNRTLGTFVENALGGGLRGGGHGESRFRMGGAPTGLPAHD